MYLVVLSESEKIRGYKTTKDGKTTSFFHRDIDDEAKKLIGSIAPKKITTPVEPKVAPASGAGSAWNNGGTYEEKNMDKWAKGRLKELLDGSTVSLFKKYSLKITRNDTGRPQSRKGLKMTRNQTGKATEPGKVENDKK